MRADSRVEPDTADLTYTVKEEALPVLKDLACLPALIKPVLVPRLTQSLQAAFERPTPGD